MNHRSDEALARREDHLVAIVSAMISSGPEMRRYKAGTIYIKHIVCDASDVLLEIYTKAHNLRLEN